MVQLGQERIQTLCFVGHFCLWQWCFLMMKNVSGKHPPMWGVWTSQDIFERRLTEIQIPNTLRWIFPLSALWTCSLATEKWGVGVLTHSQEWVRHLGGKAVPLQGSPGHCRNSWCRKKGGKRQHSKLPCGGDQGRPRCSLFPGHVVEINWLSKSWERVSEARGEKSTNTYFSFTFMLQIWNSFKRMNTW